MLKSKTDTGGFRLEMEIPRFWCRFGSLGTENYQYIIFNTDKTGVNKLLRERKKATLTHQYQIILKQAIKN